MGLNYGASSLPTAAEGTVPTWPGVYPATVYNNVDPLAQGRVQLSIPMVVGSSVSAWAQPLGFYDEIPPVNTQLSAMFLGGDVQHPVWLWNQQSVSPSGAALNANPYFLGGTVSGWVAEAGGTFGVTNTVPAGSPYFWAGHYTGSSHAIQSGSKFAAVSGAQYYVTAFVNTTATGSPNVNIGFGWWDSSGTRLSDTTTTVTVADGTWQQVSAVATAPAGAVTGAPRIGIPNGGVYFQAVIVFSQIPGSLLEAGSVVAGIVNGTTIQGATFEGTNWIENSFGSFYYSGTPAANNLIASIAPASGNDAAWTSGLGNDYLSGTAAYNYSASVFPSNALIQAGGGLAWLTSSGPGNLRGWSSVVSITYQNGSGTGYTIDTTGAALNQFTIRTANSTFNGSILSTGGTPLAPTKITTDGWHSPGTMPSGWTGTLRYALMPDNTVMIHCQCAVSSGSAASSSFNLFSGLTSTYRPANESRGPVGYFINGVPSLAQVQAILDMRWQVTTGGSVNILAYPGGATGSGITEIDFVAVYPLS
jgi:hypothetical protein